jgi:SAM-dependent methyltransferase
MPATGFGHRQVGDVMILPTTSDQRSPKQESTDMADYSAAWEKWFPIIEAGASALTARMLDGAGLAPGQRAVDIATGIGEPALTAARRVGPSGRVVAIDLSPGMLEFAARRAREAGLDNLDFRVMDANALELGTACFDIALCRWGLMFVDDLESTLGAIRAALKPRARLSLGVWGSDDEVPALATAARVLHRELELPPPAEGAGTAFALADTSTLAAVLEGAGFDDVDTQPVNIRYRYASDDEYLAHRREVSSGLAQALGEFTDEQIARATRLLENELGRFRSSDGGLVFDNLAYCVTATRR